MVGDLFFRIKSKNLKLLQVVLPTGIKKHGETSEKAESEGYRGLEKSCRSPFLKGDLRRF
jgi:hypothetical protein